MGALGDRLGRRTVLLGGLVAFGLCSAGAALSPDPAVLVGMRIGQGVGGAAILALTLAVLADIYPPEQRGHAIGWWAAIGGTGFGAGPIIGGLLLSAFGWSTIFWVNLPIIAVTIVLILLTIPRSGPTSRPRPLDGAGVVLASIGLAALTFGLITATETPWNPDRTLVSLGAGGLVLVGFGRRQQQATDPLVPGVVRHSRAFVGACVVYFASYLAFSGTIYYVTLMFQNLLGWSALRTGVSWLLMNVPFLVAAQFAGRLSRRFTPRAIVTTGCATGAIGLAALSIVTPTTPFTVAGIGYLVAGVGFGLLVPGITHVAMRDITGPVTGAASAVLNSSRQLGTAAGLAIVGAMGTAATDHAWGAMRFRHDRSALGSLATGNLRGIPDPMKGAARDAFEAGYHVALVCCVASLVLAGWLSFRAFRQRPAPGASLAVRLAAQPTRVSNGENDHSPADPPVSRRR
jgi:MFS family permease